MSSKNKIMNTWFLLYFLISIILFQFSLSAQDLFYMYTPEGMMFQAATTAEGQDMSPSEKADINQEFQELINDYQLNAVLIGEPTYKYTCFGYAWSVSEDGPITNSSELREKYCQDNAYSNDGLASYIPASESEATHAHYTNAYGGHAARKIQNSYPHAVEGGRDYVSKWGKGGLYHHQKNHEPYNLITELLPVEYYKLKTVHSGTLNTYPKKWVSAGGIQHTVTSTVTIPVGGTLKIKGTGSVNFSSGQKLYNNGILIADGITFTGYNWNGIQFNPGSTGFLTACNINNVLNNSGAAVTSFGASASIKDCNISQLQGNTNGIGIWESFVNLPIIDGSHISAPVNAIYLHRSYAQITNNSLTGAQSGAFLYSSTATLYPYSNPSAFGNNIFENSDIGISAYNYSTVIGAGSGYNGGHNVFYSNTSYNAVASIYSYIYAENNTWYPTPPQKIYVSSNSYIDYDPIYGGGLAKREKTNLIDDEQFSNGGLVESKDYFWSDLKAAVTLRTQKKETEALSFYKSLLTKYSGENLSNSLIADLGKFFRECKDQNIKAEIKKILKDKKKDPTNYASVLLTLADIEFSDNNYADAIQINNLLISEFPGSSYEKDARLNLFSIHYIQGTLELAEKELASIPKQFLTSHDVLFANSMLKGKAIPNKLLKDNIAENNLITDYALLGNFPNPFNPNTTIAYALPYQSSIQLLIYDIIGNEVRSIEISSQAAGTHNIFWDGRNANQEFVSSGVYLYTMRFTSLENNQSFIKTSKLMLVK